MFSYTSFTRPYEELLNDVKSRLERANAVLNRQLGYSPIESLKARVKSEESARKKLERKGLQFDDKGLKAITDIAGIRVVCKFLDDIPEIIGLVKSWSSPKLVNQGYTFKYDSIEVVEELLK